GANSSVSSVVFSPDGKRLVTASTSRAKSTDQPVKLWDAKTGQEVLTLDVIAHSVSFNRDGKRLAGASGTAIGAGEVRVWDTETGQELLALKGGSERVIFSPDGRLLASGTSGLDAEGLKNVKVWEAETGQELATFKGFKGGSVHGVAFSPDGTLL